MSRKIYNRLSFMAVSWLDESTLGVSQGGWTPFPHSLTMNALRRWKNADPERMGENL